MQRKLQVFAGGRFLSSEKLYEVGVWQKKGYASQTALLLRSSRDGRFVRLRQRALNSDPSESSVRKHRTLPAKNAKKRKKAQKNRFRPLTFT